MKVILSSEVPVSRFAVFAEMGWMEKRPELGFLCRTARENGDRISVEAVDSALPGLQNTGAKNVIAWCTTLGLCDSQGGLTVLGEQVADTDEAPIPEQGVYSFWLAEHPVVGRRVLSVERRTSTRDQRFDDITPLPVIPDSGKVFQSVVDPSQRYQVRALPTNNSQIGCLVEPTNATCRLRWTLDFVTSKDYWQLDGMIEVPEGQGKYSQKPISHKPESSALDLWDLAETWGKGPLSQIGRWQPSDRLLNVSLKKLTEEEQDSFCKTIKLESVEVPGKGAFSDVTLQDVPVGPVSKEEAQKWAFSRIGRYLLQNQSYRSRDEVRQIFVDQIEDTPLEKFSPTLPSHDALVSGKLYSQNAGFFWSLVAPVDLAPRQVPAASLEALRIGMPTDFATEPHNVVRVPYRGDWSMQMLIDNLMTDSVPTRVLLCDRYVRGYGNVEALKILVQSLQSLEKSVSIEVWTEDKEADFHQIEKITGTVPRSYREVFNRHQPHDRYILVIPASGAGFGWHMSNSPLHARPDGSETGPDSLLRWKDLVASRVSVEELEPALRKWLVGSDQ